MTQPTEAGLAQEEIDRTMETSSREFKEAVKDVLAQQAELRAIIGAGLGGIA